VALSEDGKSFEGYIEERAEAKKITGSRAD